MTTAQLLEALPGRVVQVKEITDSLNNLLASNENLTAFMNNNPDIAAGVRSSDVADYLMVATSTLIDKRIPLNIVKNVYDEYAVIFAICVIYKTQKVKSLSKKLTGIFVDIISNSSKYDIYVKKRVNLARISSTNDIMEFFWLVPLFVNIKAIADLDYLKFINENKEVAKNVDGYAAGYGHFVTGNILMMDKDAFKMYLYEGVKSKASKSTVALNESIQNIDSDEEDFEFEEDED